LLNLKEDDPYLPSNGCKFIDDLSLWPLVEYAHMYCYYQGFIPRRSLCSGRVLMNTIILKVAMYKKSKYGKLMKQAVS
jgi:hypothetical protein